MLIIRAKPVAMDSGVVALCKHFLTTLSLPDASKVR